MTTHDKGGEVGNSKWWDGLPPEEPGQTRLVMGSIVMDVKPDPTGTAQYVVVREFRQKGVSGSVESPSGSGPQVRIFGRPEVKYSDAQPPTIAQMAVRLAGIEPPAHKIWTAVINSGRGSRLVPATADRRQRGLAGPATAAEAEVALTDLHLQALAGPIEKVLEGDPALPAVRQFLADVAMQLGRSDEQTVLPSDSAPAQEAS